MHSFVSAFTVVAVIGTASLITSSARADDENATAPAATTTAPTAATAPAAAPAAAPAPAPTPATEVYLHVTSPKPVAIRREDNNELVCTSPCDKPVPADTRYTVGGERPSPSFVLQPPKAGGRADVRVKPGSRGAFWMGVGGLALGGALITSGVATLVYARNNQNAVPGADGVETDNSYTDLMIVGTTLIIGGAFAGLWGGATVVANAKTSVRGNVQKAAADPASSAAPARPLTQQASVGLPKPVFVSILSGAF